MRKADYFKVKTYTVENTFGVDLIMPAEVYSNLRAEIDEGKTNTRIHSVEPYYPKNGMTGCKILAVELSFSNGVPEVTHGYVAIAKDSDTQFKMDTPKGWENTVSLLIKCRAIIKKSEVNTIWFDEGEFCRNMQRCTDMKLRAWILMVDESKSLEAYWRQAVKDAAIEEAKTRVRRASLMWQKLENVEV